MCGAGICFEPAAEDKQMIEKPIQVFERLGVDRLGLCQRADQALGPVGDGAREVEMSGIRGCRPTE